VEERLAVILGDIDTCPHGHAIPDKNGNIKPQNSLPLSRFHTLQRVNIVAIDEGDSRLLSTIEKKGLKPQVIVTIRKKNEDGSMELEAGSEKIKIDAALSTVLLAEPVTSKQPVSSAEVTVLSKLPAGQTGVLKEYIGERNLLGRCLSLGFTPGSVVKMLENFNNGPVLVKVHDTEIALGRDLAENITVTRNGVK
jgi:Fe2+ transport system protein FeoA